MKIQYLSGSVLQMWMILALGSALFAGLTSILAKCGIKTADSTVATAIRTAVVLPLSFLMVLTVGSLGEINKISTETWIFLILSGIATGASWLCYFRALQIGDVNKVVPIDKSSTALTIIMAFLILQEPVTWLKGVCVTLITVGTLMMIEKKDGTNDSTGRSWLLFACLSAVFAALTAILGKMGIEGVESNLGTMIRTFVVLLMSWMMVFVTGKEEKVHGIPKRELMFICLSGLATGASWLCYFGALSGGPASIVVPIDKLSILVTIVFSYFVFGEKLTHKALFGLVLITAGTLMMIL